MNFLVQLEGTTTDGRTHIGLGECQPRGSATGDRTSSSWEVLEETLRTLANRVIQVPGPGAVTATVRELMAELAGAAAKHAPGTGRLVPFRGTLVGIETALLDLTCRALELPLATVLGSRRDKVPAHADPIPVDVSGDARGELLRAQAARYPAKRVYGTGDVAESLTLLESAAIVTGDVGDPDQPLWVDLNGRLDRTSASAFVSTVVASIAAGRLPRQVLINNAVPHRFGEHVVALQHLADRAAARCGRPDVDVRIVAGQSTWRPTSLGRRARLQFRLHRVLRRRLPRAVLLKPAEVGGVLATLDLAAEIRQSSPGTQLYLGARSGATEITGGLLRNLAMVMPDIVAVADDTVASEPVLVMPTEPGIGARVPYDDILGGAKDSTAIPAPVAPSQSDVPMNEYHDVDVIRPLGLNFTKGYLLEREALARGLSTRRFTRSSFIAFDGQNEVLTFKRSRTPLSSAVAMAICTHKETTRIRLQRAGVPVPEGATFAEGDHASARAYVERIGYPVVVKPAMGVSGAGVAANIRDDDALLHAFDRVQDKRFGSGDFIVEQHIHGHDHRIVVVGDEVVGAILRDPASVVGDGQRTVAELIVAKNLARRANPHLWGRPIKYDHAARYQLERAGLHLGSVPERGQKVVLASSGNLALGADSVDVLDDLHPSIKDACVRAVRAIPDMGYCGIDFLLEDHTKPLDEQQGGICELNAHAAIGNCEYPIYGMPREVARRIIEECIRRFDLAASPQRADRLALKLTIRGRVIGVGYPVWMRRRALETGLSGWIRNVDSRTSEAVVIGDLQPAAALAAAAVRGPRRAAPTEVTTTHLADVPDIEGFRVVRRTLKEYVRGR